MEIIFTLCSSERLISGAFGNKAGSILYLSFSGEVEANSCLRTWRKLDFFLNLFSLQSTSICASICNTVDTGLLFLSHFYINRKDLECLELLDNFENISADEHEG